jgi:hypothetical protein
MSLVPVGQEGVIMSGRMNLAPCLDAATASLAPYRAPGNFFAAVPSPTNNSPMVARRGWTTITGGSTKASMDRGRPVGA